MKEFVPMFPETVTFQEPIIACEGAFVVIVLCLRLILKYCNIFHYLYCIALAATHT